MREIKFRGKNENGWHYGLLTFMFNSYAISHVEDENTVDLIDEETIGQYTGLKDKNGVEIFEGDCFKDCDGKRHVVTFKNGGFGCAGKLLINYHTKESITTHEPLINYVLDSAEVIGNIYENPELLETKKSS